MPEFLVHVISSSDYYLAQFDIQPCILVLLFLVIAFLWCCKLPTHNPNHLTIFLYFFLDSSSFFLYWELKLGGISGYFCHCMQNDARDSISHASESFISTSELRIGKYSWMRVDGIYIPFEYNETCRLSSWRAIFYICYSVVVRLNRPLKKVL